MGILKNVADMVQYVSEAFMAIFRPADEYPAIGVQPFDGEPFSEWVEVRS